MELTAINRPAWLRDPDRVALLALLAAMAVAVPLILWFGSGVTYSTDELSWFEDSPDLGISGALQPHVGHFVLTTRILYKAIFELFGTSYLPFRLLTISAVLLMTGLLFVYLRRRVGALVALPPAIVLLFFGSAPNHILQGNGFTVLLSISCGLGALLALERRDRIGDAATCALLCLGVATYSVALTYLFAVAVAVLIRDDSRRRIWIPAVPALLYLAWWLWARDSPGSSEQQLVISDLLLLPSWGFQSLAAVLDALTGLRYLPSDLAGSVAAGSVLAVGALAALAWRFERGRIPAAIWTTIALLLSLWALQVVAPSVQRLPSSPRYLFPVGVAVLLVGAEAVRGKSWSRTALIILYAVAVCGLATNLKLLHDSGAQLPRHLRRPAARGAHRNRAGRRQGEPGLHSALRSRARDQARCRLRRIRRKGHATDGHLSGRSSRLRADRLLAAGAPQPQRSEAGDRQSRAQRRVERKVAARQPLPSSRRGRSVRRSAPRRSPPARPWAPAPQGLRRRGGSP